MYSASLNNRKLKVSLADIWALFAVVYGLLHPGFPRAVDSPEQTPHPLGALIVSISVLQFYLPLQLSPLPVIYFHDNGHAQSLLHRVTCQISSQADGKTNDVCPFL